MRALEGRVSKLEEATSGPRVFPPEAFVLYSGPRDPVALMAMLGLDDRGELEVEVLEHGAVPGEPPVLVGSCTTISGRQGMVVAHQQFSSEVGKHWHNGGAWGFSWHGDGSGRIFDYADPPLFKPFGIRDDG